MINSDKNVILADLTYLVKTFNENEIKSKELELEHEVISEISE